MATKKLKSKALAVQAPQSRDEVVEHIRIIGDLTRQRTRLAATMNDGIAELQEQYAQQADPINERIEALQAGVQVWCEANRAIITNGNKVKFADFVTGTVKWRSKPPSVGLRKIEAVIEALGDVPVSLSCDITKLHELTLRGSASQVLQALNSNDKAEKGEYVLVLDLFGLEGVKEAAREELALEARLLHWLLAGDDIRSACTRLTLAGERKNAVYAASLKLKDMMREDVSKMR